MERNWKYCEGLLKRMAESMELMIIVTPANRLCPGTWHIAQRQGSSVLRLTLNYFSPKVLLDKFLNFYDVINTGFGVVHNPFYSMSPEEAELKLAVMGA